MMEDLELATWQAQWRKVGEPLPAIQGQIRRKIRRQNLLFLANNLAAAISVLATLFFLAVAVRREPNQLRFGWAAGIVIFIFVAVGYRLWAQRGTWRPETQSTRAFIELWHRRVAAKIRMLRMGLYLMPAWIAFSAVHIATEWRVVIGPDVHSHQWEWLQVLAAVFIMFPAAMYWVVWYRRRKVAELREVEKILGEMNDEPMEI